jgi:transposase
MSTKSLLYHGFGLGTMEPLKTASEDGTIYLHVRRPIERLVCARCHSASVIRRGTSARRLRHVPIGLKPVVVQLTVQRLECRECGHLGDEHFAFVDGIKRYTHAFAQYVLSLCAVATVQDVACLLGVSWGLVRAIEQARLEQLVKQQKLRHLRRLAIDELALGKGHRYVSVVLDLDSGAAVYVGEGKGAEAVEPFLRRLRRAGAQLEAVAMDMSAAYHLAVSKVFPDAALVLDRFHVVKLMNEKLSELRRDLYRETTHALHKHVLKGSRWLLLKRPENLREDRHERQRLEEALKLNQPLATAYYLKEELGQFWQQDSRQQAKQFLGGWIATALASGIRHLKTMASTLRAHRNQLLAWYDHPISTGPLEGFNNKAQTMKRQAYGYRNVEFYKLKLRTLHLKKYALVG